MSTEQPEVQQRSPTTTPSPTTTNVVTKQKDPKRVAMGRQLGLRSKEYKLRKQQMMKSEKNKHDDLEGEEPKSSNGRLNTPVIAAGGTVLALGLVYFIYTKLDQSLRLPTLTPTLNEQRDSLNQETRRGTETTPSVTAISLTTDMVNME